jgi:hypothetical protein
MAAGVHGIGHENADIRDPGMRWLAPGGLQQATGVYPGRNIGWTAAFAMVFSPSVVSPWLAS